MADLVSDRGHSFCRACNSTKLTDVLDLGKQPLPAEYGSGSKDVLDRFPLHLRICEDCGLGQLGEYVLPERIFHGRYPYLSSASSTWLKHVEQYAIKMKKELALDKNSLVLELASNDGHLLSEFLKLDVPVLGVEPAENAATIARSVGITTIVDFFGTKQVKGILENYGHPKLIVANNVLAHVPDMQDFMAGIALLADKRTVVTIENPSFALLLRDSLFDTIYHEHYSYLTAHSVKAVANKFGLRLSRIDRLATHGGSNRYWLSRGMALDQSVDLTLHEEKELGLFNPKRWAAFQNVSRATIEGFHQWLLERQKSGDTVVGYGAAHKGNTFLNAVGDAAKILKYVVDASPEKQGKFLPGSQLPVMAPENLSDADPTDVLILPWNIAPELKDKIKVLAPKARIWIAQPSMTQLSG